MKDTRTLAYLAVTFVVVFVASSITFVVIRYVDNTILGIVVGALVGGTLGWSGGRFAETRFGEDDDP